MLQVLAILLAAHMVADYPLQSDWLADNKHSSTIALWSHTATHACISALGLLYATGLSNRIVASTVIAIFGLHAAIDAQEFSIRWDQTAHLVTLVALSGMAIL
jgi:hypothetical protein